MKASCKTVVILTCLYLTSTVGAAIFYICEIKSLAELSDRKKMGSHAIFKKIKKWCFLFWHCNDNNHFLFTNNKKTDYYYSLKKKNTSNTVFRGLTRFLDKGVAQTTFLYCSELFTYTTPFSWENSISHLLSKIYLFQCLNCNILLTAKFGEPGILTWKIRIGLVVKILWLRFSWEPDCNKLLILCYL